MKRMIGLLMLAGLVVGIAGISGCGGDDTLSSLPDERNWRCGGDSDSPFVVGMSPRAGKDDPNLTHIELYIASLGIDHKLQIIDKKKNVVKILMNEPFYRVTSRSVTWDFTNESGERVAPGLYRAQLVSDDRVSCEGDIQVLSEN